MPSWDDLKKREAPPKPDTAELDSACASVFTSAAGKRLMAELRRRHIEAVMPGAIPDERALLVNHAMRQFVRALEIATERGLAAKAETKKP